MRLAAPLTEEKPVSLAPLDLQKALTGLLQVKPPEKTEKPESEAQTQEGPATSKE